MKGWTRAQMTEGVLREMHRCARLVGEHARIEVHERTDDYAAVTAAGRGVTVVGVGSTPEAALVELRRQLKRRRKR